jgi:hypothetical protein
MPLILKHKTDRIAFQFGARSALRSANELIDQLQDQLRRERSQRAFDHKYFNEQIAMLSRELAEARYEIASPPRRARQR